MLGFDRAGARGTALALLLCAAPATLMAQAAPAPKAADAATSVETVLVTAQKRKENVQDVPMSVSAFSGATLEKNNIDDVADLARFVPSLSVNQSNNNRNASVVIRNVGTSGTNPGTDQDVGVFLDGVYLPVAGPLYGELTDIATVEVLRGPQGTLYGRNTPVGAVNITTRAPTQQREGYLDLQAGNYGELKASGYVGGGLLPTVSARVSAWYDKEDGYLTNLYNGARVWALTQEGGRGRVRWTPDALTTVDLIAYVAYTRSTGNNAVQVDPLGPGGIVFGYNPAPTSFAKSPFVVAESLTNPSHPYVVPGPWQVDSADPTLDQTYLYGGSAQISRDVAGLGLTVTDIVSYNAYLDSVPQQSPGELPLDVATNFQHDDIKSVADELRFVSLGRHFVDYVAGLYFFHSDLAYQATTTIDSQSNRVFPASVGGGGKIPAGNRQTLNYGQTTDASAGYLQATVNITDRVRILGGARYSYDEKAANIAAVLSNITGGPVSPVYSANIGGPGHLSANRVDQSVTWMYGAQYDVMRGVMVYARVASGFKDGGFNSRSATVSPFAFNPETSYTYETGFKATVLDNRLLINADIFRMLVHDYQQSTLLNGGTGFVIGNAGNFRNQGVEFDIQATPFAGLSLTGDGSYIPSKITGGATELTCDTTYPYAGSPPPPSSGPYTDATHKYCNFNGLQESYAPRWRAGVSARYEHSVPGTPLRGFVSVSAAYTDSQYLDASLDPRSFQASYTLIDGNFGVESETGRWRLQMWAKNLTNKRYFVTESAQTQAANISGGGTAAANGFIGWLGVPRAFGAELSYHF